METERVNDSNDSYEYDKTFIDEIKTMKQQKDQTYLTENVIPYDECLRILKDDNSLTTKFPTLARHLDVRENLQSLMPSQKIAQGNDVLESLLNIEISQMVLSLSIGLQNTAMFSDAVILCMSGAAASQMGSSFLAISTWISGVMAQIQATLGITHVSLISSITTKITTFLSSVLGGGATLAALSAGKIAAALILVIFIIGSIFFIIKRMIDMKDVSREIAELSDTTDSLLRKLSVALQ